MTKRLHDSERGVQGSVFSFRGSTTDLGNSSDDGLLDRHHVPLYLLSNTLRLRHRILVGPLHAQVLQKGCRVKD